MPMSRHAAIHSPARGTRKALVLPLLLTGVFLALGFLFQARTNPRLAWTYIGVAAFLLCWQLALYLQSGRKAAGFAWEFAAVKSHYVQALAQLSVYAYWGWYWRNVYAEAPLILSQVVFLYIFDALLTWSRGQTWRMGFGPWPIIFSTNLFMWFHDDWFVFQFLMVALGVLGKQFICWRRGGKLTHIFNPSAFGLTIVSLILIFTGTTGHTWGEEIAVTQGYPPHPYTEIFLCGLVVQYFFSVTLLTLSATATLALLSLAYTQMTGVYLFLNSNIPIAVFLGLHLLMTDPATTPRSSFGRIIFGGLYGAGVFWAFIILRAFGAPAFYDKLVVVPLLNLLTPALDRLAAVGVAGKFGKWEAKAGPRKLNLAYMGCWVALFLTMLATGFVEAPHIGETLGFWEKAAEENRPHAAEHLRHLLHDFDERDFDNPTNRLDVLGGDRLLSREQALGNLYEEVASIYGRGKLVPIDSAKAARYFEKACELGNTEGCINLAIEYFRINPAGAQTGIDQALSTLEHLSITTTNGRICYIVAYAYDNGRSRPQDKTNARQFYEKGAQLGELAAWKALARMELAGEGGPADHAAAALWLQKAADAQDGPSCVYLAQLYHKGDGVSRDEQKSVALLEKACSLGVPQACELLKQNRP
jgi:hypothetical protein